MEIGMIGLGRMGRNMALRLTERGHAVVGTDRSKESLKRFQADGGRTVRSLKELAGALAPPRIAWLMVPAGPPVDNILGQLTPHLAKGDLIVDGGNSNYHDTMRRGADLESAGFAFLDAGTSGGIWGRDIGYCLMVGGKDSDFARAEPILRALAPEGGYLHTGPCGSGHFAKMVHNGIEYGMLQAYGEGFEILQKSRFAFDLKGLAHLWNRGGVIRSWLLELSERAFSDDPRLSLVQGYVEDSGEGRWAVQEAMDLDVPAPVLTVALQARLASRVKESFSAKVIAALRNEFGGHRVQKKKTTKASE